MCEAPTRLKGGVEVACRFCPICRGNRVNDYVGRCLAEMQDSDGAVALTLTYAGDVPQAYVLCYKDVQLMLKSLRNDGHSVRYIVAGEYGERKGRAHWHIVLFFKGKVPQLPHERRIHWEYWPHGLVYPQAPDPLGFAYLVKYALKPSGDQSFAKSLGMSKKPPLGHEFFMRLAGDLVDRSLPIHAPTYSFAGVLDRNGKHREYWLQGRMRAMFVDRYVTLWRDRFGQEPPQTEWLDGHLDKIARKEMDAERDSFERRWRMGVRSWGDTAPRQLGLLLDSSGAIASACSDLSAIINHEGQSWTVTSDAKGGASVQRQLHRCNLPPASVQSLSRWLHDKWHPPAASAA